MPWRINGEYLPIYLRVEATLSRSSYRRKALKLTTRHFERYIRESKGGKYKLLNSLLSRDVHKLNWTRIGGLGIFQQPLSRVCKQVQLEKPVFLEYTYFVHSCFSVSWLVVYSCFIANSAYVVNNNNNNNNNKLYVIYVSGYLAYKLIGDRTKTNAEIKCLRL